MALKFNPFTGTLDYVESAATKEKAEGVPAGGETSAVLTKHSATNYDDEWAKIKNANVAAAAGIEESKLSIPEMMTLGTIQTITAEKKFTNVVNTKKLEAEAIQMYGEKELSLVTTLSLEGSAVKAGTFSIEAFEKLVIGSKSLATLKQIKLSGEVAANSTIFSVEPTCAYGIIPEGGATVIESAATQGKHGVIFLVNISTTETLTIVHEATGAQKGLASNRFHFASGENVKLEPGEAIWLWYTEGEASGGKERWRDLGAWSINLPRPSAGTGLERAAGNVFAVKPGGIKEASLENESVTYPKMAFFSFDSPLEIPAGKTYEVPSNVQGLWKDSISVQGILNVQGHFDEVGVPESTLYGPAIEINEIFPGSKPLALGKPKDFSIISSQADWSRPKEEPSLWYRPNASSKTITIEGIESAGFADGTAFFVTNRGAFNVRLAHNGAGCLTETDRFFLPNEEAVTIGRYDTVGLIYNGNDKRWNALSVATNSVTLSEVEERTKELKEAIKLAKTLTVEEALKVHLETTLEGELKAKSGATIEGATLKAKNGLTVEGALILPSESITFGEMGLFSLAAPFEVPAGKTYEVPTNNQALWKENLSVQGTLSVQGRFDEVGVPEPLWYGETGVPTEVPSGKIYDIPAINSALWRDNMSIQGTINLQGRLTEV